MLSAQADMPKPAYDFSLSRQDKIKLAESAAVGEYGKKGRLVRVIVPVVGEKFQFELRVE